MLSAIIAREPDPSGRPWGLAATVGFSVVIWYTLQLLQAAMGFGITRVLAVLHLPAEANTPALHFAVITCATTLLCAVLIVAAAALRDGLEPRAYLRLFVPPRGDLLHWLLVAALIVALTDLVLYRAKGELVPQAWIDLYRSAPSPLWSLWFWIALVVATPIFEELLFRGFIFAGLHASALGRVGAVSITALAWAWTHQQPDPLEFGIVFLIGITLGVARLRSGSLLVPIAMHVLYNLVSAGEIAWLAAIGQ